MQAAPRGRAQAVLIVVVRTGREAGRERHAPGRPDARRGRSDKEREIKAHRFETVKLGDRRRRKCRAEDAAKVTGPMIGGGVITAAAAVMLDLMAGMRLRREPRKLRTECKVEDREQILLEKQREDGGKRRKTTPDKPARHDSRSEGEAPHIADTTMNFRKSAGKMPGPSRDTRRIGTPWRIDLPQR